MNPKLQFTTRDFPARIADLGFTAHVPADWIVHDLPEDDVDFSDPTAFVPLAVLTAPHAAIVLAIAARPAHDDGTVHDWAWYHLQHQQLQPRAVGRDLISGVGAVSGEATQPSELGTMVVRFAFLEDGDRLVILTLTAPELYADAVRDAWFELARSFTLTLPRGSRFPLEPHADHTPAAPIPEPWLDTATPPPPQVLEATTGEVLHAVRRGGWPLPDATRPPCTSLYELALDDDSIALDEDHEINRELQRRGRGTVPEIAGLSDSDRRALLKAPAIAAQIAVPYGWHVADDGGRVLIFEPGGLVQLSLQRVGRQDDDEGRERGEGAAPVGAPASMAVFDVSTPCPDPAALLRARVHAVPEQAANARVLARLVLASCEFTDMPPGDEPAPVETVLVHTTDGRPAELRGADGRPMWWHEALAMEARGRLDEAEAHIREQGPSIGCAYSGAEMYRLRMLRLKARGDEQGALDAFMRASDLIWQHASMATSGGEGAALSLERDEFRAMLVAGYGSDPQARRGAAPARR